MGDLVSTRAASVVVGVIIDASVLSNWELRVIHQVEEQLSALSPNVCINSDRPSTRDVWGCGGVEEDLVDVCLRVADLICGG